MLEMRLSPVANLAALRSEGDGLRVSGHASVVEREYVLLPDRGDGPVTEVIRAGAFAETLAAKPDVVLRVNHQGLPLASTPTGTLTLAADEMGLRFDADLDPVDADSATLARKIRAGLVREASFAFRPVRDEWQKRDDDDGGGMRRVITEIDLNRGDVSAVTFGANPATEVDTSLRDIGAAAVAAVPGSGGALLGLRVRALRAQLEVLQSLAASVERMA